MTDFLANLRENFTELPDTSTIKGIRIYTEMWLDNNSLTNPEQLENACREMLGALDRAIVATEKDLESTGETHESLADPVERSIEAYEQLKEVLEDMAEAVHRRDSDEVRELLEEMNEGALFLKEAQNDLDSWVQNPVLRCPRCGSEEQDPCPSCDLELLVLDPKGGVGPSDRSALLPQEYGELYTCYNEIRSGQRRLSSLDNALSPLEKKANSYSNLLSASISTAPPSQKLQESLDTSRALQEGLKQMRDSLSTRKVTDLQDGWLLVFRNAVRSQRLRLDLLEELGGEEGAERAALERQAKQQNDLFDVKFESY